MFGAFQFGEPYFGEGPGESEPFIGPTELTFEGATHGDIDSEGATESDDPLAGAAHGTIDLEGSRH